MKPAIKKMRIVFEVLCQLYDAGKITSKKCDAIFKEAWKCLGLPDELSNQDNADFLGAPLIDVIEAEQRQKLIAQLDQANRNNKPELAKRLKAELERMQRRSIRRNQRKNATS